MEILKSKNNEELLKSILAEVAKSRNELNCLLGDANKIKTRLDFLNIIVEELKEREV